MKNGFRFKLGAKLWGLWLGLWNHIKEAPKQQFRIDVRDIDCAMTVDEFIARFSVDAIADARKNFIKTSARALLDLCNEEQRRDFGMRRWALVEARRSYAEVISHMRDIATCGEEG